MFSAGGGESKSMRFAGVSIDVLMMDGPGGQWDERVLKCSHQLKSHPGLKC